MTHPSFESLLDYVEDRLSPTARGEIERHLSDSCRECDQQISLLKKFVLAVQGDETSTPPVEVLQKAVSLYKTNFIKSKPSAIQVLANLLFDSQQKLSPAMVRGATQTRRVLYSAQQVDIDLLITPVQGMHNIIGQVMDSAKPDEFALAFVSMKNNTTGELMQGIETDSLGQFNFQKIPPGQYDLVFEINAEEVAIQSLELIEL